MQRVLLSGVSCLAFLNCAVAADLPSRSAPPVYAPPLPIFTWTGFYVGANAGYVFDGDSRGTNVGLSPANNGVLIGARPGSFSVKNDGFTGGGQIGYNYQFGQGAGIVVGFEADASYTDLNSSRLYRSNAGASNTFRSGMDYLGTVSGRVGYSFGQILVYGTGGFAYGDVNQRVLFTNNAQTAVYSGSRDGIKTGYAYGGGVEYALPTDSFLNFFHSSAVTIKAEYLHYDLGKSTVTAARIPGSPGIGVGYAVRFRNEGDLARVGINYKF